MQTTKKCVNLKIMELKWDLIHHLNPKRKSKADEVYQKVDLRRKPEPNGTEVRLDSSPQAKKEDKVYQKVNVRRQLENSGTEMRLDSSTEA